MQAGVTSGITALMDTTHKRRYRVTSDVVPVPCAPLGDWLLLLRATTIDFFSLDGTCPAVTTAQVHAVSCPSTLLAVEGAEMTVLKTLPWQHLSLGVLVVECKLMSQGCRSSRETSISNFVTSRGMHRVGAFRARHDIWDMVFVNQSRAAALNMTPLVHGW